MANKKTRDELIKELFAQSDKDNIPFIIMTHNGLEGEGFQLRERLLGEGSELAALIVCLMEMNPNMANILKFGVNEFDNPKRPRPDLN